MATAGPYSLYAPGPNDLADVPGDFTRQNASIDAALNKKLDKDVSVVNDTTANYQKKIKYETVIPTSGATYVEGDIIFVVST
jgi:hypothetical protein